MNPDKLNEIAKKWSNNKEGQYNDLNLWIVHIIKGAILEAVEPLEKEILILQKKNQSSLANNLCPDHRDKQGDKNCLACSIETLSKQLTEAQKDKERLEKLVDLIWRKRWDNLYEIVGIAAEIRSGNYETIDSTMSKEKGGDGK